MRQRSVTPQAAECVERIRGHIADAVVCGSHDKLHTGGKGAELSNNQPAAKFWIVEQGVVPLKASGVGRVVVIGVIADDDIRDVDHIFYKTGSPIALKFGPQVSLDKLVLIKELFLWMRTKTLPFRRVMGLGGELPQRLLCFCHAGNTRRSLRQEAIGWKLA